MVYLILSIFCSTIISVVFKFFTKYEVNSFQAIIWNYWVCVIIGSLVMREMPIASTDVQTAWFPYALLLGTIFIGGFYVAALTIKYFGIAITAVAQRMSIIITATFAIIYFKEAINFPKIAGILLAIVAVILTNLPQKKTVDKPKTNKWLLSLPVFMLLSSGFIECVLQYVQVEILTDDLGQVRFTTILFGTAATIGLVVLILQLLFKTQTLNKKSLIGGVALGIPNFGSIFFLLQAIRSGFEGSVLFPINNIAVLVLLSIIAVLYFKEALRPINLAGIGVAIIAIFLISAA